MSQAIEHLQVERFLSEYKQLVVQLEQAKTRTALVDILCKSSGSYILPSLLFNSTGELKKFQELRALTHQQLSLIIKGNTNRASISCLLLVNLDRDKKILMDWSLPSRLDDATDWFVKMFKVNPISCDVVRATVMNRVSDLRLYLTVDRKPRTDISLMLRQLRELLPVLR